MKKILLGTACFFAHQFFTYAQTLYGLTRGGGADGGGAVIKLVMPSNNLSVASSFESSASAPQSGLIQASNGKMYGTTSYGGSNGYGIIYSYDPSSSTYTKLKNFEGIDGANPVGLMQANDGKLYGMTTSGGSNNYGVIFSFNPSTSAYTKLLDFDFTNGSGPSGSLVQTGGKLYGLTTSGGSSNYGVIFSYNPSTSTYTKLMEFGGTNGARPTGSLLLANDGKLYGMTAIGGKYMYYHYNKRKDIEDYNDGYGVVFSLNPQNSSFKKLVDFDGVNVLNPQGSLIQADNGKLYGTTSGGVNNGGVIFSYTPSSQNNYATLYIFNGLNGFRPRGSLVQAGNGKLYGTTSEGGAGGYGVVFSYDPVLSAYNKMMDFDGTNGSNPLGSLIQGSNGKLYGTTNGGYGGVIFSYDPNIPAYNKLVVLGYTNGTFPSGNLTPGGNGKLYGMASAGGSNNYGVIFSFDLSSSIYTKLKDFDGINGNNDGGCSLIQASDGKLYGITGSGGSSGNGVIFSFNPSSSTYTKLMDFNGTNGSRPNGSLIQISNGKLYGTTSQGGSNNVGVIFSYDPATSTYAYTSLGDSASLNGANPIGGLVHANNGKLYGMTYWGGNYYRGVIFSFDPSTSTYEKVKDFGLNNNIQRPTAGGLVQAGNGKLYGTTSLGENSGNGVVIFSFDPATSVYTSLTGFGGADGASPGSALIQASDGKLYGMAYSGGNYGYGVIFSFDITTSTFTKLQDFNKTNGASPSGTFVEINGPLARTSTDSDHLVKKTENKPDLLSNDAWHSTLELTVTPNPVINSTFISFTIQQPQHASLKIFDANGEMIKVLTDKKFEKGQYKFQWNPEEFSAGIYFLRFDGGSYSETKKLSVIR